MSKCPSSFTKIRLWNDWKLKCIKIWDGQNRRFMKNFSALDKIRRIFIRADALLWRPWSCCHLWIIYCILCRAGERHSRAAAGPMNHSVLLPHFSLFSHASTPLLSHKVAINRSLASLFLFSHLFISLSLSPCQLGVGRGWVLLYKLLCPQRHLTPSMAGTQTSTRWW